MGMVLIELELTILRRCGLRSGQSKGDGQALKKARFFAYWPPPLRGKVSRARSISARIGLPLPGRPQFGPFLGDRADHVWVHGDLLAPFARLVSGGSLLVASSPILEPSPLCGEAKSR